MKCKRIMNCHWTRELRMKRDNKRNEEAFRKITAVNEKAHFLANIACEWYWDDVVWLSETTMVVVCRCLTLYPLLDFTEAHHSSSGKTWKTWDSSLFNEDAVVFRIKADACKREMQKDGYKYIWRIFIIKCVQLLRAKHQTDSREVLVADGHHRGWLWNVRNWTSEFEMKYIHWIRMRCIYVYIFTFSDSAMLWDLWKFRCQLLRHFLQEEKNIVRLKISRISQERLPQVMETL